ncbi:aldo/keto reductase [Geothrix sp. PMB-07]|uniref:aldo/keto reductase n=1 Tax=Geothrix sp. PMB-07 TaxID=3068640 RepID=UPI00274265B5|nr:aldo/keto reductase [Geothrix sp. PMB-07]WLT30521.1 hypothetical protein Q9293_12420 [Geothrix sp. PMB-07]
MPDTGTTRRDLFKLGAATAAGLIATRLGATSAEDPPAAKRLPEGPFNPATAAAMPTRNLGRTGHLVGLFSLGGQAAIEKSDNEKVAIPLIERALDLGVNYLDTSARYGGEARWSEHYFGQVMKRRRKEAFRHQDPRPHGGRFPAAAGDFPEAAADGSRGPLAAPCHEHHG